ncbi:MAG TPA: GNAT family N-acetyltransferase [Pirellulales bacterium]|nr:GNAT family N-acetyltransferase [Pirellulales bacterium]
MTENNFQVRDDRSGEQADSVASCLRQEYPGPRRAKPLTVRLFCEEKGHLPPIADLWRDGLSGAPARQQLYGYGWYAAWSKTYGTRRPWTGRSRILVVQTDDGETVALLPLVEMRLYGANVLSLAGFFQPNRAFVCADNHVGPACQALAQALFCAPLNWHVLRLGPMNADLPESIHLFDALRGASGNTSTKRLSPMIVASDLPTNFEAYQREVLGKRFTKDILYYERRLRSGGSTSLRHFANPQGQELEEMLSDCRIVESRSWLSRAGGQLRFAKEVDFSFWRALDFNGSDARLDTWVLYFEGQPISFAVTITAGSTRHMIANQFDPAFQKHSTGSILYFHAMNHACRNGVTTVDFGGGDLHYKGRWGGVEAGRRAELVCFRPSPLGWALNHSLRTTRSLAQAVRGLRNAARFKQRAGCHAATSDAPAQTQA